MARYRGPKTKIARKVGEPIFGADKTFDKKNYPPGIHGLNKKRMKLSEYGIQLKEKQKAKFTYGVLERQFKKTFNEATRSKGVTGEVLLQLLERRLDNVVYRLGIAPSRRAARQLVTHKHITVNGELVNVPSYKCRAGDIIAVRERSKSLEVINDALEKAATGKFPWLEWDGKQMAGKFTNIPERTEIPEKIEEQLIVELYSK
jgi:small subunit ribosomal protein S4